MQVTTAVRLNIKKTYLTHPRHLLLKGKGEKKKVSDNHFAPGRKHCSPMAFLNILPFSSHLRHQPSTFVCLQSAEETVLRRNDGAISKVTESRWAGPDSRCLRAGKTINSRLEDGQPELMLRLASVIQTGLCQPDLCAVPDGWHGRKKRQFRAKDFLHTHMCKKTHTAIQTKLCFFGTGQGSIGG